jgi:hypothetical protein
MALASTGDLSGRESAVEEDCSRVEELEAAVASLTKQNTKLKNELRFTTETERWAGLLAVWKFICCSPPYRRTSGECIANLQKDIESLQSRNELVILYCWNFKGFMNFIPTMLGPS